jgi:hypothetical protein
MVAIRAQTVLAGTVSAGRLGPAGVDKAYGIVIARAPYWAKQPLVLRNTPFSITNPSDAQVAIRMTLAALAKEARGKTWKEVRDALAREIEAGKVSPNIPPAAMYVQAGKDKFKEVLARMGKLVDGKTLKELRSGTDEERKKYYEIMRKERMRTRRTLHSISHWISEKPGVAKTVEEVVGKITR